MLLERDIDGPLQAVRQQAVNTGRPDKIGRVLADYLAVDGNSTLEAGARGGELRGGAGLACLRLSDVGARAFADIEAGALLADLFFDELE